MDLDPLQTDVNGQEWGATFDNYKEKMFSWWMDGDFAMRPNKHALLKIHNKVSSKIRRHGSQRVSKSWVICRNLLFSKLFCKSRFSRNVFNHTEILKTTQNFVVTPPGLDVFVGYKSTQQTGTPVWNMYSNMWTNVLKRWLGVISPNNKGT